MGKAIKATISQIYQEERYFHQGEKLKDLLISKYEDICQSLLAEGIQVKEAIHLPFAPYIEMLKGYTQKKENREAKIIYSMANFKFSVKPFTATYHFAGSIDQLRQNKDGSLELIAFKSGRRRGHRLYELFLNYELSIYAYALFQGELSTDEAGYDWHKPEIIADYLSLYFLQDHYPYRRNGKKRDEGGNLIAFRSGEERGGAIYRTTRSFERLKYIPQEIGRICAAIKRNDFFRMPNFLCQNSCSYRNYCQAGITFSIK